MCRLGSQLLWIVAWGRGLCVYKSSQELISSMIGTVWPRPSPRWCIRVRPVGYGSVTAGRRRTGAPAARRAMPWDAPPACISDGMPPACISECPKHSKQAGTMASILPVPDRALPFETSLRASFAQASRRLREASHKFAQASRKRGSGRGRSGAVAPAQWLLIASRRGGSAEHGERGRVDRRDAGNGGAIIGISVVGRLVRRARG